MFNSIKRFFNAPAELRDTHAELAKARNILTALVLEAEKEELGDAHQYRWDHVVDFLYGKSGA